MVLFYREHHKKLSALQIELAAAREEGFTSKYFSENDSTHTKKKFLAVIGILTTFGRKKNRDAIRKAWMSTGKTSFYLLALSIFLIEDLTWIITWY